MTLILALSCVAALFATAVISVFIGRASVARDGETVVCVRSDRLREVMQWLRDTAGQLHAPRGLSGQALAAWLTRVGEARGVSVDCASIVGEVEALDDRRRADLSPLVRIARDIHRWKREIIDGRGRSRHSRGH